MTVHCFRSYSNQNHKDLDRQTSSTRTEASREKADENINKEVKKCLDYSDREIIKKSESCRRFADEPANDNKHTSKSKHVKESQHSKSKVLENIASNSSSSANQEGILRAPERENREKHKSGKEMHEGCDKGRKHAKYDAEYINKHASSQKGRESSTLFTHEGSNSKNKDSVSKLNKQEGNEGKDEEIKENARHTADMKSSNTASHSKVDRPVSKTIKKEKQKLGFTEAGSTSAPLNESPKKEIKKHGYTEEANLSNEEFEPPTMSFESYLNYDVNRISKKKKKPQKVQKSANNEMGKKQSKGLEGDCKSSLQHCGTNLGTDESKEKNDTEASAKKFKKESLNDLLKVPLPTFLPDCSVPSSLTEVDTKPVAVVPNTDDDSFEFTGRRSNSKMQVFSGSKPIFLSKMLSLYEQCIRVLKNNIDLLYEVGGVPYDILEPVLEHCTAEQLFRIEECNPTFVEETDHLWKKHCLKDFRSEQLKEYESWREMYLRVFKERENKLKMVTKNISFAQSAKPKGRQVKLAYVNTAAKPPRDVRRMQELHGTAGPIVQPHPLDKHKVTAESKSETSSIDSPQSTSGHVNLCSGTAASSGGSSHEPKKGPRKIAPMMAKTLRVFKNRVGPR
ncbi:elongin-A-like isoform X2 [Protopterus annectens]|uniref:elongin-A-like isoform X2 n=1 Tax=Protopterus annectens TaxID=7888 RepID=UPI001CFAD576|nr:elongin-A-like isoform X2 [Protopterus annectens]